MMRSIIDTNVLVVANRGSTQASLECVLNCINGVRDLMSAGHIVLDTHWYILREYGHNLRSEGQPGVGDAFLKWILQNHSNPEHCEQVAVTPFRPGDPQCTDFREFPVDPGLTGFDPADCKFVAVAMAHPDHPPIWNAVDPDWWQFRDALTKHGLTVRFICDDQLSFWEQNDSA